MMFFYGVATKATPFEDYVNNISIIKTTEIMCWSAIKKSDINRLTAKDNIPVTKFVNVIGENNIYSMFYDFNYNVGQVYKTNICLRKLNTLDTFVVENGFHSYYTKVKLLRINETRFSVIINSLDLGFVWKHPSTYVKGLGNLAIADCIIPKGAHYFLNYNGEYVSDAIKIINVYEINIK